MSWSSDFALFLRSIKYNGIILWILVESGTVYDFIHVSRTSMARTPLGP